MEHEKLSIYLSAYHDQGLIFAPHLSNSLGQLDPDFLRFLWGLADRAARDHWQAIRVSVRRAGSEERRNVSVASAEEIARASPRSLEWSYVSLGVQ